MSILKFVVAGAVLLVLAYLAALSFLSRVNQLKVIGEQLEPCPDKPNCVSSLAPDEQHAISPFALIDGQTLLSWKKLMQAIERSGGEILIDDGQYAHAVFTSVLFRFKDDLEVRLDKTQINIRSASRAGTSDLGENRKRVEQIRQRYAAGERRSKKNRE